ncbi:MAG: ABC transporter substrate-binding protein [Candidatus Acidiferrales bacterium]
MARNQLRIVSLAPNVTSILHALDATNHLVGVSRWCKDVAPIASLPTVGDCWRLNVSEVMKLRPTLLIGSVPFAIETVEDILAQPVAFLAINPRSLADIERDIRTLARLVGRAAAGERLISKMKRAFDNVKKKAAAARRHQSRRTFRPVVYAEAWPNPRISSPPWVAELIEHVGGISAVPAGAQVSDDEVARAKPDIIVLAWTATGDRAKLETALKNPSWRDVPAILSRCVYVIRDEWLNTPGPPLIQGAETLFRAIWKK